MTRVRCQDGLVHFRNPVNPVQTLFCAIRNEPYNTIVSSVTDKALDQGIFDAVKPDGKVTHNDQA